MSTLAVSEQIQRKFWINVALPDAQGCMLWMGNRNVYGYGRLRIRGRQVGAHRVSLFLSIGPPPDGKPESAHACRNRHCCAPAHLRWADRKEQAQDKERDGTMVRGEQHALAKLTANQVKAIRSEYAEGSTTQQVLADRYGVQQAAVSKIVLGRKWRR